MQRHRTVQSMVLVGRRVDQIFGDNFSTMFEGRYLPRQDTTDTSMTQTCDVTVPNAGWSWMKGPTYKYCLHEALRMGMAIWDEVRLKGLEISRSSSAELASLSPTLFDHHGLEEITKSFEGRLVSDASAAKLLTAFQSRFKTLDANEERRMISSVEY